MAKNVFKRFRDVTELVHYLDNTPVSSLFKYEERSSDRNGDSFSGTSSYDEANNLIKLGDSENANKIYNENGTAVTPHSRYADGNVLRLKADIVGYLPNVPAYNMGLPYDMLNKRHVRMRKKVVSVYVNMSVDWTKSKEKINEAALMVVNAVMDAEKMGVRVNLYSGVIAEKDSYYCGFAVKIKTSSQYMDKLKMAYPLVNPSFLRRHYFRFVEEAEGIPSGFTSGYGKPLGASSTIDFFKKFGNDKEMKFDCVLSLQDMCSNPEKASKLADMFVHAAI